MKQGQQGAVTAVTTRQSHSHRPIRTALLRKMGAPPARLLRTDSIACEAVEREWRNDSLTLRSEGDGAAAATAGSASVTSSAAATPSSVSASAAAGASASSLPAVASGSLSHSIDCIIWDVSMPVMSGTSAFRRLHTASVVCCCPPLLRSATSGRSEKLHRTVRQSPLDLDSGGGVAEGGGSDLNPNVDSTLPPHRRKLRQ